MLSARKKCICQLCTCGRHMCLHRNKDTHLVLGEDSASKLKGEHLEAQPRRGQQEQQWNLTNGVTEDISSEVDQINAQQFLANAELQEKALTVHNKGNSQINASSSGNSWSAKQVPKTLPIRPPDNLKPGGEADFRTLHQLNYTKNYSDFTVQASSTDTQQDSWNHKQVPKTLPIKKPDTLTLNGPLILETTNKSDFTEDVFQNKAAEIAQGEKSPRPRTSLKLSGEFQSDSSYQRAFTPKHAADVVKVKKGTSVRDSHLKPEGDMSFDTTSLDYRAALIEKSKLEQEKNRTVPSKPKPAKPQSGIKIPEVPLEDETTAVTDYKRWNVGKPERHRPADTLQLGDGITDIEEFSPSLAKKSYIDVSEQENDPRWQVSRPTVKKPQNNLGKEENFETQNDVAYLSRRSRYSQSNLETVAERNEREIAEVEQAEERSAKEVKTISASKNEESNALEQQASGIASQKEIEAASVKDIQLEAEFQDRILQSKPTDTELLATEPSTESQETHTDNLPHTSQNGEQMEYVTWDQIRPKPIRPHSNLRQEGGMEFSTTNRSEFIQRSTERVKGIRPKTTTKVFEGDFDATTMNQIMFTPGHAERMNPIRPKSNLHVENGQFVHETTTAREYQQWEIKRPSPIVHKSNLMQQGSIDFTTTNRTEFEEKRPEKVYPIRPTTTNRISGDLDLTTTNQLMHGPFPIERVQKIVPQPNLRMNSGVFNSETTNRTQFQEYHVDRPKPIRPISNLRQEGSMDFTTMNQLQFEEKPMEKVSQFRPQTSSKLTGDFDGVTTNRMMYTTQPIQKQQMIKPKSNIELEKGTFERDTTKQLEFKQWETAKPQAITPRNNLQQVGDMDFTTTNQLQYAGKTGERVSQIRPKTNPKITGEFDGTTTNRMMYQNVVGEKPKPVRPKTNLQVEKGNFMGETTNNREFQNWGYEKPTPIKPKSSLRQEGTMDYTTTNNMQFEPKTTERPVQIRPTTSTKITGDFDGTTTNQITYQNNAFETVKGLRPSTNIHLEGGKFEDQTTARREYQPWEMAKAEPIKPSGTLTQEGTMDFTTSNKTDFGVKPITKTEALRPHTSSPLTGEFDGTTTNQIMYQAQTTEGIKPESFKPKSNLSQEGNIDFVTSNQLEYEQKTIERTSQIRPKTHTKLMDGKFHGETTNQVMFQAPEMQTVHAIRPPTNLKTNEGAFQGNTTAQDTYQQWRTERPKAFQLTSSLKQEGEMSFETTSNSEYKEKSFERVQQIRPKTSSKIEGDFVGTTTTQDMFHQPENFERVQPIRHQNNLHLEQGRFSDETTTNREYKQWVKMNGQIAVPKKKLQAAGIRTQRERPNRRKEITKTQERDTNVAETGASDSKIQMNSMEVQKDIPTDNSGETSEGQRTNEANHEEMVRQNQTDLQGSIENNKDSKDISAVKSDYGGEYGTRTEENVSQKDDLTIATSKFDNTQQTSVDKKQIENIQERTTKSVTKELKENGDLDSWKLAENENASIGRMTNEVNKQEQISEQKQQGTRHYRPPDNLRIEHVPFDGTSTNRSEYKKWEARRSSLKKRHENLRQEGEMRFVTTSNDYSVLKDHQINREVARTRIKDELKKGTLTPNGSMEFSTTSKSSYVGLSNVGRPKNLRPRSSLRLGVSDTKSQEMLSSSRSNPEISTTRDNYDFTSTSRASYLGHTGSRARANRPSTSQKVGEGTFEGQSMTQSSFKVPQEAAVKSRIFKPESHNIFQAENGFSGNTTYRSSFETKKGHCPVLDLEAGKSSLSFKEERNGHVFYAPRVQG